MVGLDTGFYLGYQAYPVLTDCGVRSNQTELWSISLPTYRVGDHVQVKFFPVEEK